MARLVELEHVTHERDAFLPESARPRLELPSDLLSTLSDTHLCHFADAFYGMLNDAVFHRYTEQEKEGLRHSVSGDADPPAQVSRVYSRGRTSDTAARVALVMGCETANSPSCGTLVRPRA